MKKAELVVRILLGALFLWASLAFFFNLVPQPELSGDMATFMAGFMASKYLFPLIKGTELIVGLAFITGLYVPLATVVLFPITVNIVLTHVFLAPEGLVMSFIILAANLFLAYANRSCYEGLFVRKR